MTLRTITLDELRARSRQRADMERSSKVGDSELDGLINESLGDFHDLILSSREDWLLTYVELSLTGSSYSFPNDVWRVRGVDRLSGTDYFPLKRLEWEDRGRASRTYPWFEVDGVDCGLRWNVENNVLKFFPTGTAPGAVRFTYIPTSPVLSGSSQTLSTPYTVNNWDAWIVNDVAAKMLSKEESDPSDCLKRRDSITARITAAAKRDDTGARQMVSTRVSRSSTYGRFPGVR